MKSALFAACGRNGIATVGSESDEDVAIAFRTGFVAGWDARGKNADAVLITREELDRLQRKAGEGPMVFP